MDLKQLQKTITSNIFLTNSEKELHNCINSVLTDHNVLVLPEYELCDSGRIDFYLPESKIGIEVKIRGASVLGTIRQLQRYAKHPEISGLLFVTTSRRLAFGMPNILAEKQIEVAITPAFG